MPSVSAVAAVAITALVVAGSAPSAAHSRATAHSPATASRVAPADPAPSADRAPSVDPASSIDPVALSPGASAAAIPGGTWRWPVGAPHRVLRRFDVGPLRWSAGHRGVDLAAAPGAPIRAPAPGRVRFVGVVAGQPVVSIDHGTLISTYQPVVSALAAGDRVSPGDVIGSLSALPGHCSPAACLHWGVRRGETYIDPLTLLGLALRPIVLKPLGGSG